MWARAILWYTTPSNWLWALPPLLAGLFASRLCAAFLPVKPKLRWKLLLCLTFGCSISMIIWVGDNNLLFTLPPFYTIVLLCTQGNRVGRLTVCTIFFCIVMSVSALLDTYVWPIVAAQGLFQSDLQNTPARLLRLLFWGVLWLLLRRRLPQEPPKLTPRLWHMSALLAAMPLSAVAAVVVLTRQKYDSWLLHSVTMNLGLAVLPFVLMTSLALLFLLKTLDDAQRLEQEQHLASLRERYYQALRREQNQLRALRHDLRNHFTAIQGLLERGDCQRAAEYVQKMAGSPALDSGLRLCENETANVVLVAKAQAMEQIGVRGDFAAALPAHLPIGDPDLCALLGNALDNAMEAAEQAQDKVVTLRCRVEKGLFMLRVENAVEGALNPDLSTTKADKSAHGFGLAGMREIARRYGGSLETRTENGRFELVACLPLDGAVDKGESIQYNGRK